MYVCEVFKEEESKEERNISEPDGGLEERK